MKSHSIEAATDEIFKHFDESGIKAIKLATPLGLGKPNQLLNALYNRVKKDPTYSLDIYTALSLDLPEPKSALEGRFLGPFIKRQWGEDYPRLDYLKDLKTSGLPAHINLHEFYVNAGAFKNTPYMQQKYLSINYTHVAQSLADVKVQMIVQLVAKRGESYSLSGNTDLTLDIRDLLAKEGERLFMVGVVHPDLPFLGGEAVVDAAFFDLIVESPEVTHKLFAVPREPLTEVDTVIGLHASQIIEDGGTLQIGIGSLSDSLVQALLLRQSDNERYRKLAATFVAPHFPEHNRLELNRFESGLYGTSEMVMDGFMHLREAGILKRTVQDKGQAIYLHAGFALGSQVFYDWMNTLSAVDFQGFAMSRISKINDLYDSDENSLRRQRVKARFFNTCMQVTLLGAAASETLEDATVISGVGGQYNFVAMAHELDKAHSILMLRSTSYRDGRVQSNIVWNHGNLTIPRHLRDVVITEYGIAFLRGKSDEDVIKALLNITDSAFQAELLKKAKAQNKVSQSYEIPAFAAQNASASIKSRLRSNEGFFKVFPFGSDFNPEELRILRSLVSLKSQGSIERCRSILKGLFTDHKPFASELTRMGFGFGPRVGFKDRLIRYAFLGSLGSKERTEDCV
ncbi:MAG: acetyl-CoA hydrolase [Chitinophagaceae bacterium]|nr:acetyl-CoA hydrolase [Oligoflexus sp.]